jgi:hypothetical protein
MQHNQNHNSNQNTQKKANWILILVFLGFMFFVFMFDIPPIFYFLFPFLIIGIIVMVQIQKTKTRNSNTQNTSYPPGKRFVDMRGFEGRSPNEYLANYNPVYTNTKTAPDAHLCDTNQHTNVDPSYRQSLNDMQSGYTAAASPSNNRPGTTLSKQDKMTILEEYISLLSAGIITREEYAQRIRELS